MWAWSTTIGIVNPDTFCVFGFFFFLPHLLLPVKDKLIKENMVYLFINQLKRLFFRKVIL